MHRNIFYTDDDHEDQEMFIEAINELSDHVRVTTHGNGYDLIFDLNNPPPSPSLIFLDLNMPVKNGFEVLQELKKLDRIKDFPVVIFTTSDHPQAVEITRKLGARLYIPKPTSFSALKSILKDVLSINWETFVPSHNNFVYRPINA